MITIQDFLENMIHVFKSHANNNEDVYLSLLQNLLLFMNNNIPDFKLDDYFGIDNDLDIALENVKNILDNEELEFFEDDFFENDSMSFEDNDNEDYEDFDEDEDYEEDEL